MRKRVTIGDLRDQLGMSGPRPFLYCATCGAGYSANGGDYFMAPASHVFKCCGRNMALVTEQRVLREVQS